MPLTKEQLLQKRFKFIMPYPSGHWEIGEMFYLCGNKCYATDGMSHLIMHESILMAYPHIFQPLPWYSHREISDLPEYVKRSDGSIVKVLYYGYSEGEGELYLVMDDLEMPNYMDYLDPQPATIEEYNAYINQKQQ